MIKIFFDSSAVFSAIYSSKGASRQLVKLVRDRLVIGIITENVIDELIDNVFKFRKPISESNINQYIKRNGFIVRERLSLKEIKPYLKLIEEEDAHILAGAILTKCDYLVTLDKKHINNEKVKKKFKEIEIISPKELLLKIIEIL